MSITLHTIFINKITTSSHPHLNLSPTHFLKPLKFQNSKTHFSNYRFFTSKTHFFPVAKSNTSFQESYGVTPQNQVNDFNLDSFLSIIEFLSLVSSSAISVYAAVQSSGIIKNGGLGFLGSRILVWQCVVLISGVVVGAVIRRRQWQKICGVGFSRAISSSNGVNLLERVEKLEEDLRSSATIIRVLSRQLEKLGIRFRVTRKALKEPIEQTAALAQKNSEATRALAAQEDILEKELGEIQKVLLAMQEQQQKQLELILTIAKAGKLWETKQGQSQNQNGSKTSETSVDGVVAHNIKGGV
ncbi:hypothetical protein ACJIZ3_004826 [Penstemon smallii]|uniref:Transmembrane protein n=1 Tax=Penstemon smallii TaxID=265156 RepID=A0ABD3S3C8_9LAMI